MVLANAIIARRGELGLSMAQAAARGNISATSWRVIEEGTTRPSPLTLGAVCRALDWPPETIETLLDGDASETVFDLTKEPEADDAALPVLLDAEGLTRKQLAEVQELIDELRGFSRPYD
jgi:transcriptional regulator with XRE-family HTH domain